MNKLSEDLKARKLKVAAVICENNDGNLQILGYDENGLVNFISEVAETMLINKKLSGNMVSPIAEIRRKVIK